MAGVVCSLVHTDAQESKSARRETASLGRGGCVCLVHPCGGSSPPWQTPPGGEQEGPSRLRSQGVCRATTVTSRPP